MAILTTSNGKEDPGLILTTDENGDLTVADFFCDALVAGSVSAAHIRAAEDDPNQRIYIEDSLHVIGNLEVSAAIRVYGGLVLPGSGTIREFMIQIIEVNGVQSMVSVEIDPSEV